MARVPKRGERREIYFDAEPVTVEIAPASGAYRDLSSKSVAQWDGVTMLVREGPPDVMITRIIHETLHEAMPKVAEKHINSADDRLRRLLVAFGVDLSPMLKGYRKP